MYRKQMLDTSRVSRVCLPQSSPLAESLRILIRSAAMQSTSPAETLRVTRQLPARLKPVALTVFLSSHKASQGDFLGELRTYVSTHPCADCLEATQVRDFRGDCC
eukprot:Gregarina_sp_Poly_1__197@NODE_1046_length_5256_cov_159_119676_g726_i0_p9_GENE_NODE_1046_length_5256_cov_159_119676_g726_i0NODE_1046_length_5256_cov_159_119676_g726_i0_p9_ORF_typecomplete_len105_score9_33_NODE_1046_length_5256_cov_159_119676_g726_i0101415